MPQELQLLYLKTTGAPTLMHSVDAAEALRLGDYVSVLLGPDAGTVEAQAAARSQAMTAQAPVHPEMMSPEQRETVRREANLAEIRRLEDAKQPVPEALMQAAGSAAPARGARQAVVPKEPVKEPDEKK
jgi:hypothetical protein